MPADPTRVQEVFLAAAERTDPAERSAYLDQACAGDAALRARVEALLRAHDESGSLLGDPTTPAPADAAATQAFTPPGVGSGNGPASPDAAAADAEQADVLGMLAPPGRTGSLGRLGHYEVLQVLGRGGFGVVFRAFDDVLQRVVAVKVLAPSLAATSPARKRFLREARASAPIQHENVVRVYEVGEQPLPYLVMEFIPGETLQQALDRTGPLEVADVLRIGRQVALGLAAAHEQGLIHRDIKPANILIDNGPRQQVKISDFGLARAADDASLTRSGVVAGTPMYMAPEQARGESLDHRADLFSLGSVLYTMLTGHPPFRAGTTLAVLKRVTEDPPRPIREIIPEVPSWLCRVVEKLHAKDPAGRFQTAREVADVLADCEAQLKAHGAVKDFTRIPGRRPAARWWRPTRARVFLPVAAVLLAALAGVYFLGVDNIRRYLADEAFFAAEPRDSHIDRIVLWDRGQEVARFTGTGGSVAVAPGRYDVEVFPRPGYRVIVEYHREGIGSRGAGIFEAIFTKDVSIARGEELRVVIRTEKLSPDGTKQNKREWVRLFNGKDLTGWVPRRAEPGAWKVENGVLVGRSERYGELVTEGGTFQDYELRVEARINAGGDSGVFNRVDLDKGNSGYEVRIGCFESARPHTGAVLILGDPDRRTNQQDVRARLTKPDEWFTLQITLRGNRIVTSVNGATTVDYVDPERRYQKGHIVLQLLENTVVEFRKIEIRELPKAGAAEQPFVLLTGGQGERGYATLAEAVRVSGDGDTIEVRADGPFVNGPVKPRSVLTISNTQPAANARP